MLRRSDARPIHLFMDSPYQLNHYYVMTRTSIFVESGAAKFGGDGANAIGLKNVRSISKQNQCDRRQRGNVNDNLLLMTCV
jgi:hypothetical protein